MNSQELIKLNNKKREKLNEENLKYYEDMLVYLRLSFLKSEQETEELLNELLDHLLEAQEEGKTSPRFSVMIQSNMRMSCLEKYQNP